ncbi:MAG: carbohydrate ABC transporter permease [Clostridiales bacterium]|jgi:putative aldouronate transport system permease protein|nr:carbohydrate ABC transporter permease [Clostridiales bacterium]
MVKRRFNAADLLIVLFTLAVGVVCVAPYLHIVAKALNDSTDTLLGGLAFWPRRFTLENVRAVLTDDAIVRAAIVSLLRVAVGTAFGLVLQFLAAYALTKRNLRGRSAIMMFFVIPMFVGGGLIPTYILFSKLRLLNSFLVYVVPGAFSFFNVVVMRTYIYTIPESLAESARIDAAGELVVLFRIILPLCMPIIAVNVLWSAVGHWNDWTSTLYFVNNKALYTLQFLLMQVVQESERVQAMLQRAREQGVNVSAIKVAVTPESLRAAQIFITTIPIIAAYPWLQKYFVKGVMIGSVKG